MADLKKKPLNFKIHNLKSFSNKRNRLLLKCFPAGLGDCFMYRMLFKCFHESLSNCHLTVQIDPKLKQAIDGHPYIDEIVFECDENDYGLVYDLSVNLSDRYERFNAPCKKHRADIWCNHYGIENSDHSMHFILDKDKQENIKIKLEQQFGFSKKLLIIAPKSNMQTKSLNEEQISQIKKLVESREEIDILAVHNKHLPELDNLNIAQAHDFTIDEFIHLMSLANYVISVDTAAFHLAGGLRKPLLGIFTFADGKVYGKHFNFVLVQKHRDDGNWDCGPCYNFSICPKSSSKIKPCCSELNYDDFRAGIEKLLNF